MNAIRVQYLSTCEDENPLLFFKKTQIYRIESKSENSEESNCPVERSFEDFRQLWRLLESIYPSQLIPPLPTTGSGRERAKFLEFALQAALDHFVLRSDEYFLAFLNVERFGDQVPLIKNVEPPITVRPEYFKKWPLIGRVIGEKLGKDYQYHKIEKSRDEMNILREKLKKLVPLFDRLSYERREAATAAGSGIHAIKNLLYLSKAKAMHADDFRGVEAFLSKFETVAGGHNCPYREVMILLEFCNKYISDTEKLVDKLDRFRDYLMVKRQAVSDVAIKLERMQMPLNSKPSFDQIYQTKSRHEKMLEETAVIEVTYEKYSELVEREFHLIRSWIRHNLNNRLSSIPFSK